MHSANFLPLAKSSLLKVVCIIFVFCAATAIVSSAQTYTTLASFNLTNGANPGSPLVQGTDGNFYSTAEGGTYGQGTVFRVTPSGTLTPFYSFCPLPNCADGSSPNNLFLANDGNFYGTTASGGTSNNCPFHDGCGTAFKMTPQGTLTTIYNFCTQPNCADGYYPSLVQASDGNFYGATNGGGANQNGYCLNDPGCGTVFKLAQVNSAWVLTTLYNFCSQPNCADGDGGGRLLQATDGSFYGATPIGGNNCRFPSGCGTLFRITPGGTLTTLHSFDETDGYLPGVSVQATDGNLYGTTDEGGANGVGTVFKSTLGGTLTSLHSFSGGNDGELPSGLVQATDMNFYGTTYVGGPYGHEYGTIFSISAGGMLNTLYGFGDPLAGTLPTGGVVQGTNGTFYGTTTQGGANNYGVVFSLETGLGPFVETVPTSGAVGAPVIILGTNLTGSTAVTFNGLAATFTVVSASEITTTVPFGATTGPVQVTTPAGVLTSNINFRVVTPLQLVPVTPCRVVDTRSPDGEFGGPRIQGGTFRSFPIPQNQNCDIPASAVAYSLNVTVVPDGTLGYLTIWPTGDSQPVVSTMNSPDGRVKANAAIVQAGAGGAVSVYVSNTTNVILDIDGYFALLGSETYQFYPLTPCRLVDTRGADGELGGPRLAAQAQRTFPLLMSSCIPTGLHPNAYSLNFTVIPNPSGQPLGYLTVWPTGETQPGVSTLNNPTATVVANAAIVPAGTGGAIDVYPSNTTDLLIDIDGYFATPGTGGLSLYPVAPCRVLDTRQNNGQPFMGEKTVNVEGSACAPVSTAAAYIFNATVVPPGSMPFLTLWPNGELQPGVSTLNAYDGFITSNMAIVPTNNGSIDAYAAGLTQLLLDISGYFAP